MAAKSLPDQAYLCECFCYDPETGILRWKSRPLSHFPNGRIGRIFNTTFAGKVAGKLDRGGRIVVTMRGSKIFAHRIIWKIMLGLDAPQQIDHRDGTPSNNRWTNLRSATHSQNQQNRSPTSNNKTGYKGVTFHRHSGTFRAVIHKERHAYSLGYFHTAEEAGEAYQLAARYYFGEFYRHGV